MSLGASGGWQEDGTEGPVEPRVRAETAGSGDKEVGDVAVCDLLRGGLATSCDDDRVGDLAVFG
jgi:hypothetical protein